MSFATANSSGALTTAIIIQPNQLITLPAITTSTPVASLCLDSGKNIIEKTTTGSCI